jgi:hypothetical protein
MSDIPLMMTVNELSKKSGLPTHFIRRMCREDKIVHVYSGKKIFINYNKFCEYLNSGENTEEFIKVEVKL